MEKQVIILTKSVKHGGFCVAGIEVGIGRWIRFISGDEKTDGALTSLDLTYEDGSICEVLDIVTVTYVREAPTENQPENILIDRNVPLIKNGTADLDEVLHTPNLCANNRLYSIYATSGPYVKVSAWYDYLSRGYNKYSLVLVKVKNLYVYHNDKYKLKANFDFTNRAEEVHEYRNISVTDLDDFHCVGDEGLNIPEAYLVISFPNSSTPNEWLHEDVYYKFIAKIFAAPA